MPEWVLQLAGYAVGAAAVYAGIRADLARLHERVNSAHQRLDDWIGRRAA